MTKKDTELETFIHNLGKRLRKWQAEDWWLIVQGYMKEALDETKEARRRKRRKWGKKH